MAQRGVQEAAARRNDRAAPRRELNVFMGLAPAIVWSQMEERIKECSSSLIC